MFGIRKKPRQPNFIESGLVSKIADSITDEDNYISDRKKFRSFVPLYSDFSIRNPSIPQDVLLQLPRSWQKVWNRLDFDIVQMYLEGKIDSNGYAIQPEVIESPDNPLSRVSRESEVQQDLFKLNDEAKTKFKALTFGIIREEEIE